MMKNLLIFSLFLLLVVTFFFSPKISFAKQNNGAEIIKLYGGEKYGPVEFAHHTHQKRVGDCQVCHKTFSQKKGAISAAVKSGNLKKKQVMNKTCNKCHRTKKEDGKRTGPTKCKSCHIKPVASE